jgi:peptidoglycan-associated lipoprotein
MTSRPGTWLVLIIGLSIAACGRREPPPAVAPTPSTPAPAPAARDEAAERAREAEAAAAARRREAERVRAVLEARVYFDYDDAALRADARAALDEKARALRDNPEIRLRIEGHADERGSTEYNLALGSRRAASVVAYLTGFGIVASRLETVSLGEERPLDAGHDETAWRQNRRAEFVIVGGALGATESAGE